jgi:Invasin, domain 3
VRRAALVLTLGVLALGSSPALANADTNTVTIGPTLPQPTGNSSGCDTSACTYLNTALPTGTLAQATSSGTITSWSVQNFDGSAQLDIVKANADGTYTMVAQSAVESEPCSGVGEDCDPVPFMVYTFTSNLPIAAGEYIGIDLETSSCPAESDCPQVGFYSGLVSQPYVATTEFFKDSPALNSPATPMPYQQAMLYDAQEQVGKTVSVSVSPSTITADGRSQTTATATVKAGSTPVSGDDVSITSSDPDESVGAVTSTGSGTYTATITASHTVGKPTITATDTSDSSLPSGTATLTQVAPTIKVSVKPKSITADGKSTATVTATVTDLTGALVPGEHVIITAAGPGLAGLVTDTGGSYTTTVTATHAAGKVTITATDESVDPEVSSTATLTAKKPVAKKPKPKKKKKPKPKKKKKPKPKKKKKKPKPKPKKKKGKGKGKKS